MELNQREKTFVGIPNEFYDEDRVTKLTENNIKQFAYSAKVLLVKNIEEFFAESGEAYTLLRDGNFNVHGCKTYTCMDLDIYNSHKDMVEYLDKLQVISILDIYGAKSKPKMEGFLRKWFEAGKSVILLYPLDLKRLEGFSDWFVELLRRKSEWLK